MKLIQDSIAKNDYVARPHTTQSIEKLKEAISAGKHKLIDASAIHCLIQYPDWHTDLNLFRFVKPKALKQLKNDPKCFFLFDTSTEGFSTIHDVPYFDVLYYSCEQAGVDPEKVIFFSSNMYDESNIVRFNMEHNKQKSIKVVTFNNFESMLFGIAGAESIGDSVRQQIDGETCDQYVERRMKQEKQEVAQRYKGKIFLSLSRVNRPHRTLSAYEIFHSDLYYHGLVSHDLFKKKTLKHWHSYQMPTGCNISGSDIKKWQKNVLPLTIDTDDFITNHAMSLSSYLHQQTLFQIVNETFAENWQGTSLFWSEKTFRSIYHLQPFLIFGQRHANLKLQDYGYKIFDNNFDYSFDEEHDTYKRWSKLREEVEKHVNRISALPITKQIDWRWRQADLLAHNLKNMVDENHTKSQMTGLVKYMVEKINEQETNT